MILWTLITLALSYISFKRPINEGSWFARGVLFMWIVASLTMIFIGVNPNLKD